MPCGRAIIFPAARRCTEVTSPLWNNVYVRYSRRLSTFLYGRANFDVSTSFLSFPLFIATKSGTSGSTNNAIPFDDNQYRSCTPPYSSAKESPHMYGFSFRFQLSIGQVWQRTWRQTTIAVTLAFRLNE